jgi:drug/metabolite transporter (DMT)-like permease
MSLPGRKRRENSVRNPDRVRDPTDVGDIQAKLMLVLLCFIWGATWPLMKIALDEIPIFGMRTLSAAFGAVALFLVSRIKRRSLRIPNATAWAHIVIAALFNLVGFSTFSALAQLYHLCSI